MSRSKRNLAWHFVGETLRDGRAVPADGEWLEHVGPLRMCKSGLHFSRTPAEALKYAPGQYLCLVEIGGEILEPKEGENSDKGVCSRRRIIAKMDATDTLRYFARMQALSVIHLWDAPDVVCDYLMTGDEELRAAAWAAARDAAWAAARAAARDAAWAAARAAAWDAAWAAARDAAWAAAMAAAMAAARDAAWDAAWDEFNQMVYECFEDVLGELT